MKGNKLNIFNYNRIIIIGNNGSGKSYLSKKLSDITNLPLVHLDIEYWRPNWEKPSQDEWNKRINQMVSEDKWIIDGNHTETMELRFKSSDLIVFLNINRLVCLLSVLFRNGKERSDTLQYKYEKFNKEFLHFCKNVWTFSNTRKKTIMHLHCKYSERPFLIINSRKEMDSLIKNWYHEKN